MLDIPEVIVPPWPGITSAMGLLVTDLRYDATRTLFQTSAQFDAERIKADLDAMRADLAARFALDQIDPAGISYVRLGDLRYVGQGYELRVPIPDGALDGAAMEQVFAAFHDAHAREFGHAFPGNTVEMVNLHVTGRGAMPRLAPSRAAEGGSLEASLVRRTETVFRVDGKLGTFVTDVRRRDRLPVGVPFAGPAIILQTDTTTVVPPDWQAEVHASGSIILTRKEGV
jgi:N-methylhydantoinase A